MILVLWHVYWLHFTGNRIIKAVWGWLIWFRSHIERTYLIPLTLCCIYLLIRASCTLETLKYWDRALVARGRRKYDSSRWPIYVILIGTLSVIRSLLWPRKIVSCCQDYVVLRRLVPRSLQILALRLYPNLVLIMWLLWGHWVLNVDHVVCVEAHNHPVMWILRVLFLKCVKYLWLSLWFVFATISNGVAVARAVRLLLNDCRHVVIFFFIRRSE